MSFSVNELIVLALVLVLGWLLGLASRSGGGRYRAEAARERDRADAAEARIAASNARIVELERNSHPIGAGTAAAIGAAARGSRDDLSLIRGVGHQGEVRLNDAGYHSYAQVARLTDRDVASLEGSLGAQPGTIAREEWREQAEALARDPATHRARWGGAA